MVVESGYGSNSFVESICKYALHNEFSGAEELHKNAEKK